ncbi:relaxase/mobilization nuclease domain-containing protein [Qipengyuania sp. NPDC077410]|uniref:relaxase/mobilization nuclease domain-containing protein n=1 Tax=Qipengyuania sp. NPDC077410 TaxID=3364496 RepID=UPI0037C6C2A7
MITKRIKARRNLRQITRERIAHARSLIDYLLAPEKKSEEKAYMVDYMLRAGLGDSSGERLQHAGYRNLLSEESHARRAEMLALANAATRSANPVDHWLLSWKEDEKPTPGQVDQAVEMFLEHLGLDQQPAIYVLHGDTDNFHCHIAVNRFSILTGRMLEINHGFNKEAAHQAVAKIVDHFGWQQEEKQRYVIVDGNIVLSKRAKKLKALGNKAIRTGASAFEWRTGYKSLQRIAQEEAVPVILNARSWPELHERLAAKGMTYDRVGTNGVKITLGENSVAASSVQTRITLTRRVRELGEFVARHPSVKIKARDADKDVLPNAKHASEYRNLCEQHRAFEARKKKSKELDRKRQAKAKSASEKARAVLLYDAKPKIEQTVSRPPPNLESYLYSRGDGEKAAEWCNRKHLFPSLTGAHSVPVEPKQIGDFKPFRSGKEIRYAREAEAPTVFIDRGSRIDVLMAREDEVILAALKLAAKKFGGKVTVSGSSAFRERAFALARSNGLEGALVDQDFVKRRASDGQCHQEKKVVSSDAAKMSPGVGRTHTRYADPFTIPTGNQKARQSDAVSIRTAEVAPPTKESVSNTDNAPKRRHQSDSSRKNAAPDAPAHASSPSPAPEVSPPALIRSRGPKKESDILGVLPKGRGR